MLDDFEDGQMGFRGLFCSSEGKELSSSLVMKVLDIVMESRVALSEFKLTHTSGGNNAAKVFRHQLEIRTNDDKELLENKELVFAIFDWFLRYETIENGCDGMDDVSIASYTNWTDWGDGSLLNFKLGYGSLLRWFCEHIPVDKLIYLDKQVVEIELLNTSSNGLWCDEDGFTFEAPILVRYLDGRNASTKLRINDNLQVIECNHLIMTASLGYLKQNHESLFKLPLPNLKKKLIQSIGFGTVNKIILHFEKPFWNDQHGIKLVWNEHERAKFPRWAQDIIAFDVVRRQPNLLIGWIGGLGAKLMENESDSEISKTCLNILEQFLPATNTKPTKLVNCICSRWNSNPFTCGSYSYLSMESFGLNVERLHEPICESNGDNTTSRVPRILFAGEATAGTLYSTTHGAIISGWREADRLRDHLSDDKQLNYLEQSTQTNEHQIYARIS